MTDRVQFLGNGPMAGMVAQLPPEVQDQYLSMMIAMQQSAVQMQGPRALASTRRDAAAHEAGHAVVYASLGFPVFSIAISPKAWPVKVTEALGQDFWTGLTIPEMEPRLIGYQTPSQILLSYGCELIAGWAGELMLRDKKFRAGSSTDEIVFADYVLGILAEQLRLTRAQVISIAQREVWCRLEANSATLRRVETALLRHRKLDREQAAKFLKDVKVKALPLVTA
jgi:hypothetical protein